MERFSGRPLFLYCAVTALWVMTSLVAGRDGFKDYRVQSLGVSKHLWCNESFDYPPVANDSVAVAWMLPNLTVLSDSKDRFYISPDNLTIVVINITKTDLGLYHCMLKIGENYTDWYLARLGLNSEGPYFLDMWKEYEMNVIIGLSAGLGFLAVAIACMLIYHFRWQPEEGSESSCSSAVPAYHSANTGNEAHSSEDGDTDKSPSEEFTKENLGGEDKSIPLDDMSPKGDKDGGYNNPTFAGDDNNVIRRPKSSGSGTGLTDVST